MRSGVVRKLMGLCKATGKVVPRQPLAESWNQVQHPGSNNKAIPGWSTAPRPGHWGALLTNEGFMDETVTIPCSEYESLKRSAKILANLEAAGVDNWDGYSAAYEGIDLED